MPRNAKGRTFSLMIAIIVLLAGLGLLLWRPVSNAISQWQMDRAIASFESESTTEEYNTATDADASNVDADMHARFAAYNERVRQGTAGAVNDPFSTSTDAQSDLALGDEVIGAVDIPAMSCTLPLYYGASDANMAKGATVVTGTSLPLGETDSNCVIAAHRGWNSAAMFRDIEALAIGDDVYVTNRWETLHYRVAEVRVIDPSDTAACAVQTGRDLVTLLTCHPYGMVPSPSRMLVYCERVDSDSDETSSSTNDTASDIASNNLVRDEAGSSPLLMMENGLAAAGCCIFIAFLVWALLSRRRK